MKQDYYYHSPYQETIITDRRERTVEKPNLQPVSKRSYKTTVIKHNRITIYGKYDEQSETMKFSKSVCWGRDRFSRFFGRENAEANLSQGKITLETGVPTEQLSTLGKWFIERAKELAEIHLKG